MSNHSVKSRFKRNITVTLNPFSIQPVNFGAQIFLCFLVGLLTLGNCSTAQHHLSHPVSMPSKISLDTHLTSMELRSDVRELVRLLDESHPDPYTGGGGRVSFYRRVSKVLESIPSAGMSVRQFLRLLRPLVASVRDGHTYIRSDQDKKSSRQTLIELDAVGEQLYVSGVYKEEHRVAIGGVVKAIQGITWSDLVARMTRFRGHDNTYNNLVHLADAIQRPDIFENFLETDHPLKKISIEVMLPNKNIIPLTIPISPNPTTSVIHSESSVTLPEPSAADIGWGFLNTDHSIAVLRIDSMMRYREAFEIWRTTGFTSNLGDHLSDVVNRTGKSPIPAGIDERIALVPSATEIMKDLFSAMHKENSSVLVVDLRKNGGGNSFISLILGYYLYPLSTLIETDKGYQLPRFSKLYFENHSTASLDRLRKERSSLLELGDIDFSEEKNWRKTQRTGLYQVERERRIKEHAAMAPTFEREFKNRTWNAKWSGKVIVITSAKTYSAGFDLAALLFKNGAQIVGVPSAQAGNCFIDTLSYRLTNSKLTGSISYKRSLTFPDNIALGEMLRPHTELTYQTLSSMKFDPNASIRLALETLQPGLK